LIALPFGSFTDFDPDLPTTFEQDWDSLSDLLKDVRRTEVPVVRSLRPLIRVHGDGRLFFRYEFLSYLAERFNSQYHRAAATLLRSVEDSPSLYFAAPRARFIPFEERRKTSRGVLTRGRDWTDQEDAILARYFGPDENGQRQPLSDARWKWLLERELDNQRTRQSIISRVSVLNARLKNQLNPTGKKMAPDVLKEYADRRLGERRRVPRNR
jgi:hypothetical protein